MISLFLREKVRENEKLIWIYIKYSLLLENMTLAVRKESANLAWHMISPTNKNTFAKFPNLAALQLFQVLICQIWPSFLAFTQETYWSTASAVRHGSPSLTVPLQLALKPGREQEKSCPHRWWCIPGSLSSQCRTVWLQSSTNTVNTKSFAISQIWWYSGISPLKSYCRIKIELQPKANCISLGTSRTLSSSFLSIW